MDTIIAAPASCEVRILGLYEKFLTELMAPGTAKTSEVYCETLNKIRRLIQENGAGCSLKASSSCATTRGPHTAARANVLLKLFNWEIFDHPLQSRPGAKRLPSLHQDEGLFGYPALPHQRSSTPTKSSWMESTTGCITWRHRSSTSDYKN